MKYYKRGFLNPDEGMAAFCANVDYEAPRVDQTHNGSIDAGFTISDCNRQIALDFYVYEEKDYINAIHKLNTLQGELASFRGELQQAYAAWKAGNEQCEQDRVTTKKDKDE